MELAKVIKQHFEARLPVGQSDLRFRVLASDGISEWHQISAKARPRVTQFVKLIEPPAYVGGKPIEVKDDNGDVEALAGSTMKLTMTCNQPISTANVILNPEMPIHPTAPAVSQNLADGANIRSDHR